MILGLQSGMVAPVYLGSEGRRDRRAGSIKKPVAKMMEIFGCEFSDLFPRYECKLAAPAILTNSQIADILHGGYSERDDDAGFLSEAIRKMLAAVLTPREEFVVRAIVFGGKTLDECCVDAGCVTKERVRQIFLKALRKLRHPAHKHFLDGFYKA
jgi:hypothetical protein